MKLNQHFGAKTGPQHNYKFVLHLILTKRPRSDTSLFWILLFLIFPVHLTPFCSWDLYLRMKALRFGLSLHHIVLCLSPRPWTLAALMFVNPSRLMDCPPLGKDVHLNRGTLKKLFAFIQMNSIIEMLNARDSSGDLFGGQEGPLKLHRVNGSSVTCKCDMLLHSEEVLTTSPDIRDQCQHYH